MAQRLERRSRDRNVSGSSPGRNGGRIFFCADSYFGILSTPGGVPAAARKRSRPCVYSHNTTHALSACGYACCDMVHGLIMVYTERVETAAAPRGTSHVTAKQRCKYTTAVEI